MRRLLELSACALVFLSPAPCNADIEPSWTGYARDLFTGDEHKASASKEWFKTHPGALEDLVQNLNDPEDSHLALDTLVSLQHHEVVPHLLETLRDSTDGSYALALSALMNKDNAGSILGKFRGVVESDDAASVSPALLLPLVDTLGRLHVPLSPESFQRLLAHPWPEVRLSLLNYLRENIAVDPPPYPADLFEKLVIDKVYQVRLAALTLYREFPAKFSKSKVNESCSKETHPLIQLFCQRYIQSREAQ